MRVLSLCLLFLVFARSLNTFEWGFFAHQQINQLATFTLPEQLFAFYKPHISYLKTHAIDPDKRRYALVQEAPRHFIDIEHLPDSLINTYSIALDSSAIEHGILPWNIKTFYSRSFALPEKFSIGF